MEGTEYELIESGEDILTHLQRFSEFLFEDCDLHNVKPDEDDEPEGGHCYTWQEFSFSGIALEILRDYGGLWVATPRAEKLLLAAAQEFIVKVFTKTQSLETTDTLQPGTLLEAF